MLLRAVLYSEGVYFFGCFTTSLFSSLPSSAPSLVELGVGRIDCSGSAFTLADCQREAVVFSQGSCGSRDAGWVECQQTGETSLFFLLCCVNHLNERHPLAHVYLLSGVPYSEVYTVLLRNKIE